MLKHKIIFLLFFSTFSLNIYSQIVYFNDYSKLYSLDLSNCNYTLISSKTTFFTMGMNSKSEVFCNARGLSAYDMINDTVLIKCRSIGGNTLAMCFDDSDQLFFIRNDSLIQYDYNNCRIVNGYTGIGRIDGDLEFYNGKFYFTEGARIIEINKRPPFNKRVLYVPTPNPGYYYSESYGLTLTCYNNTNSLITFETNARGVTWVKQVDVATGIGTLICRLPVDIADAANYYVTPNYFNLGKDTTLCKNINYILKTPFPAKWNTGDSNATSISISQSGIYWAEVSNGCGKYRDSIKINMEDLSENFSIGNDTVICKPFNITLNSSYINTVWSNGMTSNNISISDYGTYWATVKNECAEKTDSIHLFEGNCNNCKIFIPNVFSPNNDGINDVFKIRTNCEINNFKLRVLNRWGMEVYSTNDKDKGWDGTYRNESVIQDTYSYSVEYLDENNNIKLLNGNIMVVN